MPAIFISHSSRDNKPAEEIKAWLDKRHFDYVFLDFDKHTGIGAGTAWEKRLHDEISRCHAVILVLTPNWIDSKWCFVELQQARALGKIILPVICAPIGDHQVLPDIQAADIADWNEDGLVRIEQRLLAISHDLARGFTLPKERPPFPGIHAFEMEDAAIYFGRDEETRVVIEKLDARRTLGGARMTLIVGASGAGKSSLLKAGILPQLRRRSRQWLTLLPFRPEKAPLEAFAKAIAHYLDKPESWGQWHQDLTGPTALDAIEKFLKDVRVGAFMEACVLVSIDQFEEVFTITKVGERDAFLALFAAMLDRTRDLPVLAVATGRADVLHGLLETSALALLTDTVPLLAMAPTSVPRVIEGPAGVAGMTVDRDVTTAILKDLENPEALPLLAQMLHLLYLKCQADKRFTPEAYAALGDPARRLNPVQNSVRLAADEAVNGLKPRAQDLAALREAFIPHLVRLRLDDHKLVRQPASIGNLPRDAEGLIRALTRARLLTVRSDGGDTFVEVTHEALFAAWPTLADWLEDERDFLADIERLKSAHETWQEAETTDKPKALLSGLLLARGRHWLAEHPQRFVGTTMQELRAFIADSAKAADEAEARAARMRRWLFQTVTAAALIFAIATAATGVLYYKAEEASHIADNQRQIAVARQMLAVSQTEAGSNTECSLVLAVSAYDAAKLAPGLALLPFEANVRTELARSRVVATLTAGVTDQFVTSWHPDGTTLTFVDDDGNLWQWKDAPGSTPKPVSGVSGVIAHEWVPGGKQLLTVTPGSIDFWDAAEWKKVKSISIKVSDLRALRWNNAGDQVVAHSLRSGTILLDLDKRTARPLAPASLVWRGHAWSPDDRRIGVGWGTEVRIINLADGTTVRLKHSENVDAVAWSPNGKWIAAGLEGGQVWIWDVATHERHQVLNGHSNQIHGVEFSPTGSELVSASWDQSMIVWDTASWRPKDKLTGHTAGISDVRWSPSGRSIASKASDGTIRVWAPETSHTAATWLKTEGWVWSVGWNATRKILAVAADREIVFRDEAGGVKHIAKARTQIHGGAWSASGDMYVFIEQDGALSVVQGSDAQLSQHKSELSNLYSIALSPDGGMVALGALSGIELRSLPGADLRHSFKVHAAATAFSPDGKLLAYGSALEGAVVLVDVVSGKVDRTLKGFPMGKNSWSLAWSHDSGRLAAASDAGVTLVWTLSQPDSPRRLIGHSSDVKGVAWRPDGKQLATASLDHTVRLWDASTGQAVAILTGHTSGVRSVAWSPDSRFVATGGEDGTARIFDVAFDNVLAIARRQTSIGLTAPERERCEGQIASPVPSDGHAGTRLPTVPISPP